MASDEFNVAVDESRREEAEHSLREFPPDVYKIVDPWESSYEPGMAVPHRGAGEQQIQIELLPGDKICNTRNMKCFLFSGSIVVFEMGMAVAHALDPGDEIDIQFESDSVADHEKIVGRCRASFGRLKRQAGGQITADLALLDLSTDKCSVGNTVWWPYRGCSKVLQIKFYKGEEIPKDTGVIILDQNGDFQRGCIRKTRLTDGSLHDVLGISASDTEEVAVTQRGDSGALVMSIQNSESDVVYVYGISTGICRKPNGKSLTIANSLWEVVHEISTGTYKDYFAKLVDGTQNIDFA